MENQMSPPDDRLSRDSSISLEDHSGPAPRLSRSDLYTAHQPQREAYGLATVDSLFMISLDFPTTNTADEPSTGTGSSDPNAESSSLSVLRLERYLSEEQIYERVALGMPPLGVNKATVKKYLPEIIQNMDSSASRVEATRGTVTESDERGCRRSVTTSTSTTSDGSLEPIGTGNSNDNGYLAEASDSRLLHTTSSPNKHIAPSLAGLGKTEMAPIKSEHVLASSESNQKGSDTCEQDDEVERALMRHYKMSTCNRREKWRVGKQLRIQKKVRQRKRSEEEQKEMTK